jgi:ubiquinone/menaquinone biosynthesis C-methylase UbiE
VSADQQIGRAFGRVAAEYERARPEYPREAVLRAAAEFGLDSGTRVLDLAAGTGKLTRLLRERLSPIVAVEPDDEMRSLVPGDARAGSAEHIPVSDDGVDAVFVADAFHWFAAGPALREIARVVGLTTSTATALGDEERRQLRRRLHASLDDGYMLTVQTQLYWGRLPS